MELNVEDYSTVMFLRLPNTQNVKVELSSQQGKSFLKNN